MKRFFLTMVMIGYAIVCFSQNHLPIIKATNIIVDIKEGDVLYKSYWRINPRLRPDSHITHQINTRITFYTDIDSISCYVDENKKFDFIILLNGKDSAYTEVIYQPSKLKILKQQGTYGLENNHSLPAFTYMDRSNENLVLLRNHFHLDSIAGNGNDISQVVNLMHWMHYYIKHDGEHSNPDTLNAYSMLVFCKKNNKCLNCRGLAIALNECYLALGYKSRYVTCLPKDSSDNDCHVINSVFIPSLKKWIWIDPTFDAYVMNEKGELLGIEEVRDRLIHNQPLIINPEANWNRQMSQTIDEYLYNYMQKIYTD